MSFDWLASGPPWEPKQAKAAEPDPEKPVVDDDDFMDNVRDALENGYDRCCAHCGVGTAGDETEIHERECPEFREWNPHR